MLISRFLSLIILASITQSMYGAATVVQHTTATPAKQGTTLRDAGTTFIRISGQPQQGAAAFQVTPLALPQESLSTVNEIQETSATAKEAAGQKSGAADAPTFVAVVPQSPRLETTIVKKRLTRRPFPSQETRINLAGIGYVVCLEVKMSRERKVGYINELCIDSAYRTRNYGSFLIKQAIAALGNCECVELMVNPVAERSMSRAELDRLVQFFKKNGAQLTHEPTSDTFMTYRKSSSCVLL